MISGVLPRARPWPWILASAMVVLTLLLYLPGIGGGFIFDDYPNIVDNPAVQPSSASPPKLWAAALSSPSSELKRPLASLTFAANYLASGLDAGPMKVTNIVIHIMNGLLFYALLYRIFRVIQPSWRERRLACVAGATAAAWLVLPINLTAVLYVVQRMESLANLFVMVGMLGYVHVRTGPRRGLGACALALFWIVSATVAGLSAKETAVLIPLYALCVEAIVFRFRWNDGTMARSLAWAYVLMLVPPLILAAAWLGPGIIEPSTWATRDFTLRTRLLSEPRILVDYLVWTLLPTTNGLSFYHDEFVQSTGAFTPWTTLPAMGFLALMAVLGWLARMRRPAVSLGIALFLSCHTLTGTVLPLELVYEHRNYFASMGVMIAVAGFAIWLADNGRAPRWRVSLAIALPATLGLWSAAVTGVTAVRWDAPLRLAQELARRGPDSPRAQYELGRAYIIDSHYDPAAPSAALVYAPLERAATLPGSSILPQQALIFFNARMRRPIEPRWWESMRATLLRRPATVQDESSLDALASCLRQGLCAFDANELHGAFRAAKSHARQSARLNAIYATFASVSLRDTVLALQLQEKAVALAPNEGVYRITLARLLLQAGASALAKKQIDAIDTLNVGGRYDGELDSLRKQVESASLPAEAATR